MMPGSPVAAGAGSGASRRTRPNLLSRRAEMREETHHPGLSSPDRWLRRVEDVIYLAIAALLILAAGTLLVVAAWDFLRGLGAGEIGRRALLMLGSLLLVLML